MPVRKLVSYLDYGWPGSPVRNLNFKVEIEGVSVGAFEDVQVRLDEGHNYQPVVKIPGRLKWGDVSLKRGLVDDGVLEDWYRGSSSARVSGTIVEHDARGNEVARFEFAGAWPTKWAGFHRGGGAGGNNLDELQLKVEDLVKSTEDLTAKWNFVTAWPSKVTGPTPKSSDNPLGLKMSVASKIRPRRRP